MDDLVSSPLRCAVLRLLDVMAHTCPGGAPASVLILLGAREGLSAPDGQSALEIVDSMDEPLDVIVTDLDMPGMDGMEFIRHIGERKVPAALILASGLERSLVATVESLAKSFGLELLAAIEKPTTARKLEAALLRYRRASAARLQEREAHRFDESEIREGLRN